MKKILAMLVLALSGSVFAATATVEYSNGSSVNKTPSQNGLTLIVRENINKNFTIDAIVGNLYSDSTGGLAWTRAESGVTGVTPVYGPISAYTRVSVGQKFTSVNNYGYYSIEPGIMAPLGGGLTARVGYRFRDAIDSGTYNDQTRTVRAGLNYNVTKNDAIGVRYDQQRGVADQNIWSVNYTRGF